ncbi:MAG TPA: ATP-binding protein, partial [Waterburya sp.]
AQPLTTSPIRADERVVNYIKGLNYLDERLTGLLVPLEIGESEVELPASQQTAVDAIAQQLKQGNPWQRPLIQLLGTDSLSKQLVAQKACEQLGLHLYRLPVELLPTQASELESFARLWERESFLLPIALYLDAHEVEGTAPGEGLASPLHRFWVRSNGIFFLDTRETRSTNRPTISLDIIKPTPSEQKAVWQSALGGEASGTPQWLASQFNLNLVTIDQIAQSVLTETSTPAIPNSDSTPLQRKGEEDSPLPTGEWLEERSNQQMAQGVPFHIQNQLWDACRHRTRPRMDSLAQCLDTKATWHDIVLPADEINLLHQIAEQVRQRHKVYEDWGFHKRMNRGLGINALFAGESGTGKTMAAEVIANDLRLHLYRIDLSAVVSKYIGETEKNLRRLFDAAEDGGAILFFDEADALFGKRSEVKDSHDRYANIEINYLLQRMEAYRGLAILATNMKSSLDAAFMRRLRFIVNFPFPGVKERKAMWQKVFPSQTPTEDLDFNRLAQFNLTGGSIHNIAINAAFLAAQAGSAVTMPLLLAAARTEFRKLDRPINESDFRASTSNGATG